MAAKSEHALFYKMGKISEITGLEPHVLRFWESEFPALDPKKNRAGHRVYTQEDLDLILKIKRLLYEEGFTIPGARSKLEGGDAALSKTEPEVVKRRVRKELDEVRGILRNLIKLLDEA